MILLMVKLHYNFLWFVNWYLSHKLTDIIINETMEFFSPCISNDPANLQGHCLPYINIKPLKLFLTYRLKMLRIWISFQSRFSFHFHLQSSSSRNAISRKVLLRCIYNNAFAKMRKTCIEEIAIIIYTIISWFKESFNRNIDSLKHMYTLFNNNQWFSIWKWLMVIYWHLHKLINLSTDNELTWVLIDEIWTDYPFFYFRMCIFTHDKVKQSIKPKWRRYVNWSID